MRFSPSAARRAVATFLVAACATAAFAAGCGDADHSQFMNDNAEDGSVGDESMPPPSLGTNEGGVDTGASNADAAGMLNVTPATANVAVTIVNGVASNATAQFKADYDGTPVNATWLLDRGELGKIDGTTGLFTASGANTGDGVVTARYGAREGTAKVHVTVKQTENGAPAGVDAGTGGFGGLGGVGGEPLGGAVSAAVATRLATESNASDMAFLYPYDKTVWPRGLLAPLLMWSTTKSADAVYVKLSQNGYTFEGTYSYSGLTGLQTQRVRIEDGAWKTATSGNAGDPLVLTVKIYSAADDKVYGPITESWAVAPGILKGTVYYNSYDSKVTTGGGAQTGGVIAIKPRSPDPVLAIPSEAGKCTVCHEVSANGSTLWAQDGDYYQNGGSYDLLDGGARTSYMATFPDGGSTGTPDNDRKFVWSAPYPDGTFALASSRFAREAHLTTDSKLFARADGAEVASNIGGIVQSAVTPAFSPNGRKVVFNFWEGAGANGVAAGAGRTLAILDFTCGAAAGSTKCGATTPAFSNMRQIFNGPANYPSWPSFLPDNNAVIFHNTVKGGLCGPKNQVLDRTLETNCQISTWYSAAAELWIAPDTSVTVDGGAPPAPQALNALNGKTGAGVLYVPTSALHPDDSQVNYQPTVNPVASGGYYWVVFTSRRMYGNLLAGDPWTSTTPNDLKKLWVAAIDMKTGAMDPSHPAFYLPGQELGAGNSRGFWVVDPCKGDGSSCESGDECCNGFCRANGDAGALVCGPQPPGNACSMEFEACKIDADCCDPKQTCINGRCAKQNMGVN